MSVHACYYDAIGGTWPPAGLSRIGPWDIRDGGGGGKRVSAATAAAPVHADDIDSAEAAMAERAQTPLFMIRDTDADLDAHLAARGYAIIDPVTLYAAPVTALTGTPVPPVTAFAIWEPLAIMTEIWAAGGITGASRAIMDRAAVKTGILGRTADRPAGVAFAAIHNRIAMVHAVEVLPQYRRRGVAAWMMRRAAFWAADHGATEIAVLCVNANAGANALYQRLGFAPLCGYHYRIKPETS